MSLAPGTLPNAARRLARMRPAPFTLFVVATAVLGAALALSRTATYGAGLGGDSHSYIYVANNLLNGIRFEAVTVNGVTEPRPFTLWPPLYPVALAAASLGGAFDPFAAAGPLSAAAFGATILAAGLWMRRHLQSRFLAAWGCLALALSLPLGWAAHLAAPEPLFTLFITLALIQTHSALRNGRWTSLFWAAAFAAVAWDLKYMGLALPVAAAPLLVFQRGVGLRKKALRAAAYVLIAAAPVGAWFARNALLVGGIAPQDVDYSFSVLLGDMAGLFGGWLFVTPGRSDFPAASAFAWALLLALAAGVAWAFLRAHIGGDRRDDWVPLSVFGGFALVFIALQLSALMLGYTYHGVDERHLTHLYVTFLLAGVFAVDRIAAYARKSAESRRAPSPLAAVGRRGVAIAWALFAAGLLIWLGIVAKANAREILQANESGLRGTGNTAFVNFDVARYVRENPLPGRAFTNWATLLIIRTDPSARLHRWGNGATLDGVRHWISQAGEDEHIVWFYESSWDTLQNFDASDLRGLHGLETVAELRDGVIFRVKRGAVSVFGPAYAAVAAREPDVRSVFDLHLDGRTLSYAKSPCAPQDTDAPFFLRVFPANIADLPPKRRVAGFDEFGFSFDRYGVRSDGKCLVWRALPDYAIKAIRTGQTAQGGNLWAAELLLRHAAAQPLPSEKRAGIPRS